MVSGYDDSFSEVSSFVSESTNISTMGDFDEGDGVQVIKNILRAFNRRLNFYIQNKDIAFFRNNFDV